MLGGPQQERAPAAAQVQQGLGPGELRVAGRPFQGLSFRFLQGFDVVVPVAAAVFEVRTQNGPKEVGRDFVVLPVGGLRCGGDRFVPPVLEEGRLGGSGIRRVKLCPSATEESADSGAQKPVREPAPFGQLESGPEKGEDDQEEAGSEELGGSGTNTLVVSWYRR